ncbi:MAG: transglycosylase SLT domain-containing protein [Deltaproteobacteria bacterium]|nr:transglycosylase SLT domain-containing protein [Deltaproteobacteria bacterium]
MKRLDWYANHDLVELHRRPGIALTFLLAMVIAGCATTTARSQPLTSEPMAAGTTPAAAGVPSAAEPPPAEVVSGDASQAFAAGYKAFNDHDYARAIKDLTLAADHYPGLGDYALFYLAEARAAQADLTGASATLERLRAEYPQSVLTPPGELKLAQIFLKLGRNADALSVATHLVATTSDSSLGQSARFVQAQAERAMGRDQEAYQHAMAIRESYPRSEVDSGARELAYSIRAANPSVSAVPPFTYHRSEAALLLREGLASSAFDEAQQALALAATSSDRAELLWIQAQASKADSDRQKRALLEYLSIAPGGPEASAVLYDLALVFWKEDEPDRARATFGKVIAEFPSSSHASGAMLRIGRIYEEQQDYDAARAEYGRLVERYPGTEAAEDARFRIPWSLYMARQYSRAIASFTAMRKRAEGPGEREMFDYWRARSLERIGDTAGAHEIYARLAQSVESNYYPALAAEHVPAARAELAAASLPELDIEHTPPPSASPTVRFHLSRILALRALGISELQAGEYRALEEAAGEEHSLREFILAGLQASDAWYDAIVAATRMSKSGHLSAAVAERVRYPRAYWALFSRAAGRQSLDPWLVLALARQESLFNPRARSVSDARGLMQLLPSTGDRIAHLVGEESSPNLYDPETNVRLGTAYLKNLFDLFQGDRFKAVAAYNGGEHAVEGWTRRFPGDDDEWVENIGYRETRDYVKKVIGGRREYLLLYPSRDESRAMQSVPASP